jgi:hypothetical protein
MAALTLRSSQCGGHAMQDKEREVLRQHIVWLGTQLEQQRKANQDKIVLLKRLLDPEDLGHAVSHEIRQLAYQLIINDHHIERDTWQQNN